MSRPAYRGGNVSFEEIRADLANRNLTLTQRKEAFEQLRRRLREHPDEAEAKALWGEYEGEFGRPTDRPS